MTTEIAQFLRKLEGIWDGHLDALLKRRDVDAAMADMTADPSLRHFPTLTGADVWDYASLAAQLGVAVDASFEPV